MTRNRNSATESTIDRVRRAFDTDGFVIKRDERTPGGSMGVLAEHKTFVSTVTGLPKRAYYVEGSHYDMGYLMGRLAAADMASMVEKFIPSVLWHFVAGAVKQDGTVDEGEERFGQIHDLLVAILDLFATPSLLMGDIPGDLLEEMKGMAVGCHKENLASPVNVPGLIALNMGFDVLMAHVYSWLGDLPTLLPDLDPKELRVPLFCNAFAVFGEAAKGDGPADKAHYFGRDFMFPTGGVFQDTAALVIQRPDPPLRPFVNVTAPGILGCIAAMNADAVAVGVDVLCGANSDPTRPGLNSLLLLRHCIEHESTIQGVIDRMVEAQRGVSWGYVIADGKTDEACGVEAGYKPVWPDEFKVLDYPISDLTDGEHRLIPKQEYLEQHSSGQQRNGLMVRWHNFSFPFEADYVRDFNPGLWDWQLKTPAPMDQFGPTGKIAKTHVHTDPGVCPGTYYFAPQREKRDDVIVFCNHHIIPEMRLCSMTSEINAILAERAEDLQWRYDVLNREILAQLDAGPINYEQARKLINFLTPDIDNKYDCGQCRNYYAGNSRQNWKRIEVSGCVSLFDLKKRTVASLFGYHGDDWVTLGLDSYVQPS